MIFSFPSNLFVKKGDLCGFKKSGSNDQRKESLSFLW